MHEGLIFKLKINGIPGSLLNLFENYLQSRKQRVVLNGSSADYSRIESGVPQGSVLGPLLFLVYINDDTMLYSVVRHTFQYANNLNHDLRVIQQWAYQWEMEFNPDPTKQPTEVLFSCKKSKPTHPPLIFNGTVVQNTSEQKHLCLILDSCLSFARHLN